MGTDRMFELKEERNLQWGGKSSCTTTQGNRNREHLTQWSWDSRPLACFIRDFELKESKQYPD